MRSEIWFLPVTFSAVQRVNADHDCVRSPKAATYELILESNPPIQKASWARLSGRALRRLLRCNDGRDGYLAVHGRNITGQPLGAKRSAPAEDRWQVSPPSSADA